MPLKVFYYTASDFFSTSIYEQLLLDVNKANLDNEKSNIGTSHATLYNQDGTKAGRLVWNYNVYQTFDKPTFNETGFRTIILDDGSIVTVYNIEADSMKTGDVFIDKAICTTGIYNSINDVYVHIIAFEDLRQLTIYYQ